jgi:hypothetical protein
MAIGKVNAYASVTAPQVDFGAIALNAQKFQQAADDERLKMAMTLATQKQKEFKPVDFGVRLGDTTVAQVNNAFGEGYNLLLNSFNNAYMLGDNVGMNTAKSVAEQLKGKTENFKVALTDFNKTALEGKISPVNSSFINAIAALTSGNTKDVKFNRETIDVDASFFQTDSQGNRVKDTNGDDIPLTITLSDGKQTSTLSASMINNWRNFIVPDVNIYGEEGKSNGLVQSVAKNIGLTSTKDFEGNIISSKTFLDEKDIKSLEDDSLKIFLSDRNTMAAVAYKYDPERFKEPKETYTKDDYDFVAKNFVEDVKRYYKVEDEETYLKLGGRSGKKEELVTVNVNSFYESTQGLKYTNRIEKNGKFTVEDKVLNGTAYEFSFESGTKNRQLATFGILKDKGKKHFYIKLNAGQSDSSGYGANGARSGAGDINVDVQTIFATGQNRAWIDNLLVSQGVINPKTGKRIKTYKELYDLVEEKMNE